MFELKKNESRVWRGALQQNLDSASLPFSELEQKI